MRLPHSYQGLLCALRTPAQCRRLTCLPPRIQAARSCFPEHLLRPGTTSPLRKPDTHHQPLTRRRQKIQIPIPVISLSPIHKPLRPVSVLNGVLELESVESSYAPLGSVVSIPVAPPYLVSWSTFTWNATTSPNTALSVRLYYYDGASYVLIPDNVLAGNSAGYSGGVIDISTLPAAAYGSLQAEAALSTTDTAETPTLLEWKFAYTAGPTPLPNVAFDIHGAKTIGTASNGTPLYKYMGRYTTSASGEKLFDPVEWDIYTLSLPSGSPYTTVERCPFVVSVIPNEQKSVSVTLDDDTAGSLLMYVSGGGAPVLNADVTIVGCSINNAQTTSSCGQVFLGGMAATTYTVTISAPGYEPYAEDVAVSGTTELSVSLNPNP